MRRAELASAVGLSRTTLSEIVTDLIHRGAVRIVDTDAVDRRGSGRPAELLSLDPRAGQFLGIDLAHAAVHVAIIDASHEVIAERQRPIASDAPWRDRIATALRIIDDIEAEGTRFDALQGVGVGLPGSHSSAWSIDHPRARRNSDEAREAVRREIERRFGLTPMLDVNTRLAALAQAVHSGEPEKELIYLRVADGIGGGVVVGGRLIHGAAGLAGEFGHVTVRRDGRRCRCGKRGCLETVASVPAVLESCRERGLDLAGPEDLGRAADCADPVLEEVLRESGTAVGHVLATTVLALNPTDIVVGGVLPRIAPVFLDQVSSTITFEVHPIDGARPRVRSSEVTDSGGAMGAIVALLHRTSLLADYPGGLDGPSSPTREGDHHVR
ncbi:ROK family transcriptional regulator [Nesterenkonia halobia]|uniref:ROK family transcriptional regulator n=2 Tax=Nesterenkonia halobia TaxID=37922 RepID=A0ABP6RB95_9MICC